MSFGADIKEMLWDIGTPFTILRDSGNISGEYINLEVNSQATKPFIREFFMQGLLSYDTACVGGDVIELSDTRRFLIVNRTPEQFEGQTYDYNSVLYKCNVSGELLRQSSTPTFDDDYEEHLPFTSVKTVAYGLLTEEMYGNYLEQDEGAGQLLNRALVLYLPSSYGIQPLDRYVTGGTNLKVEEVDYNKYDGVDVAHLEIDTRED